MSRVCFHSDDSYIPVTSREFAFVTAGIALDGIKSEMRIHLEKAENRSRKGARDWHSTKDPSIRARYIEELLDMSPLVGRVFYGAAGAVPNTSFWRIRVDVLAAAIRRYSGGGRCHHEMAHEGLTSKPRQQLRGDLKDRGFKRVTVEPASVTTDPETRCVDALAGFIRSKLFDGGGSSSVLPELPDWLVEVIPVQTKALRR